MAEKDGRSSIAASDKRIIGGTVRGVKSCQRRYCSHSHDVAGLPMNRIKRTGRLMSLSLSISLCVCVRVCVCIRRKLRHTPYSLSAAVEITECI